jgi:hypothetical protein
MATIAQITAALANAQLSTGPRSVEGKAAASKNALKLGLYAQTPSLPGEDPEELAALARSFTGRFRPQTPIEEAFLEDLVRAEWLKRRYCRIEAEIINARFAALPEDSTVGDVFIQDAEGPRLLEKIFRRQQAAERQYHRALTALRQAVAERRLALAEPPNPNLSVPSPWLPQKRTGFCPNPR